MSFDTQSLLPAGIYRIVVAHLGQIGPDALTRQEDNKGVTIVPPGVLPDDNQRWLVEPSKDGNVTITKPTGIRPPTALTYEGAPQAKEGERVVYRVEEFATKWHVGIAPGFRQT